MRTCTHNWVKGLKLARAPVLTCFRGAAEMAEQDYKSKTPVEVAIFLKDNGISGDICDIFEGKFSWGSVRCGLATSL